MAPSLRPICSFQQLDPRDIISAIKTSSHPLSKQFVVVPPLGLGYERFLEWSLQDINTATPNVGHEQQTRFSVGAVMNARRSLSCLADQYLIRDCFSFCKDAPRDTNEIAALLVRRGVFDELAAGALRRAVNRRNRIEHQYESLALDDAQDCVHLIRSTIENGVAKSDPYAGPALFGSFFGGFSGGPHGPVHSFDGWNGLLFALVRNDPLPWFGMVVPSSSTHATVSKVSFSQITCNQLLEVLIALEDRSSNGYSKFDDRTFRGQLACLGLCE